MTQHKNSGFTIIELIITISIMAILTTLVVVSLRTSQDNAKAKERKDDVDAIARTLENIYSNGIQIGSTPPEPMGYPSTALFVLSPSIESSAAILAELEPSWLKAPDSTNTAPFYSLVAASNAVETVSGVTPQPVNTAGAYVYQPMTAGNLRCLVGPPTIVSRANSNACQRFNIYYKDADGNTVKKESINR